MTVLLNDSGGGVRDPALSYDAKRILFSYRKGGTHRYHLYEINTDGSGLRQLTDGDFDDIEPCYLPDGGIAFCSTRSYRGELLARSVHDPVPLRCGREEPLSLVREYRAGQHALRCFPMDRILYTRWEYVDRHNTAFHDLWVVNPDGTGHMVYWGNEQRNTCLAPPLLDARPIPDTADVVAISGGHGTPERRIPVCIAHLYTT